MLHLLVLLEAHVWYVFLVGGAVTIFISLVRVDDLHKFKCEPREQTRWLILGAGILFLGLGILFYFFRERIGEYPDLSGAWSYEVRNGSGQFSHKGESVISGNAPNIRIFGTRLFSCHARRPDGTCEIARVSAPWIATWAQLCSDGRVRFNYTIDLPEGKVEGYCSLAYDPDKAPAELTGIYYMLPPFDKELLNARFGQIVFRKMKKGEQLLPPTRNDISAAAKAGLGR